MSRNVQKFVGIAGYLAVLTMYLPFFLEETDVAIDIIYLAFVLAGGLLAAFTLMDKGRWARWGLLGVIPGVAIGALSVGLYAWVDAQGQDSGWEDLIVFVGGGDRRRFWRGSGCNRWWSGWIRTGPA